MGKLLQNDHLTVSRMLKEVRNIKVSNYLEANYDDFVTSLSERSFGIILHYSTCMSNPV